MDTKTKDNQAICTYNQRTLSGDIAYDNCIVVIPPEDQQWVFRFSESLVVQKFIEAVVEFRAKNIGADGCSAEFKVIPAITKFGFELVSTNDA